jgi:proline iminopeptidase
MAKAILLFVAVGIGCAHDTSATYFDSAGRSDAISGGARRIAIDTPAGKLHVWTKRVGNNPRMKVLLLHGGPGATHEYLEAFDSWFPGRGIEYYYYDQLGSGFSDTVEDGKLPALLTIERFVDEVEQVRKALGLGPENFYLYGQSWGGILAIEYALRHQEQLKGLIISNMMSSIPAYNRYANDVLIPPMDPQGVAELRKLEAAGQHESPRYEELLGAYYQEHLLRMPIESWPEPVLRAFSHLNRKIYVPMQGPSEMGASGALASWDRSADLAKIKTPTLVIGASHDTMDPKHMQWMAQQFPRGRFLLCEHGSHLALYDDREAYFSGMIRFIEDVDAGRAR